MDTFWTIFISALTTLIGAAFGGWATYRTANPKREFRFTVVKNNSLLNTNNEDPELTVRRGNDDLRKPRIIDLHFEYRGKKPITAESFHTGAPITVNLGAQVKHVISSTVGPTTAMAPELVINGEELEIRPSLWASGQQVEVSLLVDGDAGEIQISSPLTDAAARPIVPESEAALRAKDKKNTRLLVGALFTAMTVGMFVALVVRQELMAERAEHKETRLDFVEACQILNKENVQNQNARDRLCGIAIR
ncbi:MULTISPECIES: hypothetical protein [Streptomyces]|uniref:Uncharacterized protein n=1 Tax=Streptomyces galilaeus TaxID=33899 RepID=A0ABW9IXG1_STRGJ